MNPTSGRQEDRAAYCVGSGPLVTEGLRSLLAASVGLDPSDVGVGLEALRHPQASDPLIMLCTADLLPAVRAATLGHADATLAVVMQPDVEALDACIRLRADILLTPHEVGGYLSRALTHVRENRAARWISPALGALLSAELGQPLRDRLSDRESDVWALVQAGASNADIAERLYLSTGTVKNYVTRIFRKVGVSNRREALTQTGRREDGKTGRREDFVTLVIPMSCSPVGMMG